MKNEVMEPVSIVGISGSLRKASFSTEILKVLAKESAPAIQLHVVTLEDIPLYNEDLDTAKIVLAVNALKRLISSCDGVLISTPEYNHGIPGVLKNTLDWLSRPVFESCFKDKPVSIIEFLEGIHGRRARAVSATRDLDLNARAVGHGTGGCRRRHPSKLRGRVLHGRGRTRFHAEVPQ